MRKGTLFMLWAGLLTLAAGPAAAEWRVWTAGPERRVLRGDAPGEGSVAAIAAARNETRSFQILMRSDEPVKGITLTAGSFGKGVADVRLYRQHQLEILKPSSRNKDFKPDWYPDPLIPFENPLTGKPLGGGTLKAQPSDLPAGQTQGYWIDVYVQPDAPAGEYTATFTLATAGGETSDVTARLTVWDFALPATPAMQSAFGSPAERVIAYYAQRAKEGKDKPVADAAALGRQCAQLLADHKINATPAAALVTPVRRGDEWAIPPEKLAELKAFIERYHVNTIEVPQNSMLVAVKDPEQDRAKLAAWLDAFNQAAEELGSSAPVFFLYVIDEPNDLMAYQHVQKWGKAVRAEKSVVKVMTTEQTKTSDEKWGNLYGAVDIWCPLFPLFDPETSAQRQALGETIWAYTALCQRNPTPWWQIDFPLLNYRVPSWIAWRFRVRGLLYWGGMSHWKEAPDPWTDAWTYGHKNNIVYNGEGTLVYPGRKVGYEGIAPSLRLKALRDGIQDYDYMALLEKMGKTKEAEAIVRPLAESWFTWEPDAAAYDQARAKLAALLVK